MLFILNNLEVFPADCPEHTMFLSHAAYFFKLLFGPCMFIFDSGVPAYSQFVFVCFPRKHTVTALVDQMKINFHQPTRL